MERVGEAVDEAGEGGGEGEAVAGGGELARGGDGEGQRSAGAPEGEQPRQLRRAQQRAAPLPLPPISPRKLPLHPNKEKQVKINMVFIVCRSVLHAATCIPLRRKPEESQRIAAPSQKKQKKQNKTKTQTNFSSFLC